MCAHHHSQLLVQPTYLPIAYCVCLFWSSVDRFFAAAVAALLARCRVLSIVFYFSLNSPHLSLCHNNKASAALAASSTTLIPVCLSLSLSFALSHLSTTSDMK